MLRVVAGLDKLIAEGRLEELLDALRELVKRIPELMPEAMRGGELEELARELQGILNQFFDLLEALPPEAGEVAIEILQLALDIAGLFPGPGDAFDVIGALIAARRGEWLDVLLSVGSAVFLAGIALGIAKIGKRLKKLASLIAKLKGPAREILGNFIEELAKAIKDIPLNSVHGAIDGLKGLVEHLRKLLKEAIEKLKNAKRKPHHVPKSRGVWDQPPAVRGEIIERRLGHNVPPGFKTIDRFENGVATSIKSIDLTAESYKNTDRVTSRVKTCIDEVAAYRGADRGVLRIKPKEIKGRELLVAIPPGSPKAQRDALTALSDYARQKQVVLKVVEVQ